MRGSLVVKGLTKILLTATLNTSPSLNIRESGWFSKEKSRCGIFFEPLGEPFGHIIRVKRTISSLSLTYKRSTVC